MFEKDSHEPLHGFGGLEDLRTQDGAFPAGQKKTGGVCRVDVGADVSGLLGSKDAMLKASFPAGEDRVQPLPEGFVLSRQFLAQVADQTAPGVLAAGHGFKAGVEVGAQPVDAGAAGVIENPIQFGVVFLREGINDRQAEIILAAKVVVERPLGYASCGQHGVDACRTKAFMADQVGAGVNNVSAGVG
mgnify:CR=1 FL=1